MGLYNHLMADVTCPFCQTTVEVELQISCGLLNLIDYRIGHTIAWLPRKAVHNGGRPEGGSTIVDGYGECPSCDRDYFVPVHIEKDRIVSVDSSAARPGYEPGSRAESTDGA